MSPHYLYRPLYDSRTVTRLFTLDRLLTTPCGIQGTAATPHLISGSMSHVSLDEKPSYKALSYAWGNLASPRYPILVDGSIILVTQNLYQALREMQTVPNISTLWIDAVCINQIDDEEKGMQVPLMHDIFSQAEEVLIWLGPAADQSTEIISIFTDWASKYTAVLEVKGFNYLGSRYLEPQHLKDLLSAISDGFPADLWLQPVAKFIARSWWHRIWVLQELILAKRAVIHCGNVVIDWNVMERVIEMFSYPKDLPKCNTDSNEFAKQIIRVVHLRRLRLDYLGRYRDWTPGLSWEGLLEQIRWPYLPQATDERDRIYGLMALLNEEDRNGIKVDYSTGSTLIKILFHISCIVIGRTGPRCMVYCDDWQRHVYPPEGLSPGLPSWSPNWLSGKYAQFKAWEDVYDAARGTKWTPKLLSISFADPKLRLSGIMVDHIVRAWSKYALTSTDGGDLTPTLQDFRSWSSDIGSASTMTVDADNLWWLAVMPSKFPIPDSKREQLLAAYAVFSGIIEPNESLSDEERRKWCEEKSAVYRKALKFHEQTSFVTSKGHLGLGSLSVQVEDKLAIFEGCSVPFIIRQREDGDYHLIGPCYVLNMMDGETMEKIPEFQDITLV